MCSLWPRLSKNRRTKKQQEFKSSSHARTRSSQRSFTEAGRRTPPLDRCSDITDNTISELHKAGALAEQPGACTTSSLHSHQWSARVMRGPREAVTFADEPEDPMMDFDGSDEEFQQMLSKGIARRRDHQVGKKTVDLQTLTHSESNLNRHKPWISPARTTTQRRASNPAKDSFTLAVNVKIHQTKRTVTQSQVRSRHKHYYRPNRQRHELARMPRRRSARIVHQR